MDTDKDGVADLRLEFLCNHLLKMWNLKIEKWQKMIASRDNRNLINEFLNAATNRLLLFVNNGVIVTPYLNEFPSNSKGLIMFFQRKRSADELTVQNMSQAILCGTCSGNPIDDLDTMVNDVFLPILTNTQNQTNWPKVVVNDVNQRLQELRNTMAAIIGNMSNIAVLPLPITLSDVMRIAPGVAKGNLAPCTAYIKESLEQITIKWSQIINNTIKEDSYSILESNRWATPNDEIDFWKARLKNLNNIRDQLNGDAIRAIRLILDRTESVFAKILHECEQTVEKKLMEAADINRFLKPFQAHIDFFEMNSFDQSFNRILPLIHTICLIWSHSQYLCTNKRMIHLFRVTQNMLMLRATDCLDPESIFQCEFDDNLVKLGKVLKNFDQYKNTVMDYWKKLDTFLKTNSKSKLWSFKPEAIFIDLDEYVERVRILQNIFEVSLEFKKMEELVFGGLKGQRIMDAIADILNEFNATYCRLEPRMTNILNIYAHTKSNALTAINSFFDEANLLERSLAKQFNFAFDQCASSLEMAKMFICLGSIVQRPTVMAEIKHRFEGIAITFNTEILEIKQHFESGSGQILKNTNNEYSVMDPMLPSLKGDLGWLYQLRSDLQESVEYFSFLYVDIFESDYGRHVQAMYNELLEKLDNFEKNELIGVWSAKMLHKVDVYMKESLLKRDNQNQTLLENFPIELASTFEGIKALMVKDIPIDNTILTDFVKREPEFRIIRQKLRRIVQWYNQIRLDAHDTELKLITNELAVIDEKLDDACTAIQWDNFEDDYVESLFQAIKGLHARLQATQNNIKSIRTNIDGWGKVPLFTRSNESANFLNIADREKLVNDRYALCLATNKYIAKKIEENHKLFFNDLHENENIELDESQTNSFNAYKQHINTIAFEGIVDAVETSVRYIKNEVENAVDTAPVFQTRFELQKPDVVFIPAMDTKSIQSLAALVEQLLSNIYGMADQIRPIDDLSLDAYSLRGNKTLEKWKADLIRLVTDTCRKVQTKFRNYTKYETVWATDRSVFLQQFLTYGRPLSAEEMENVDAAESNMKPSPPTLAMFQSQIDYFISLQKEIENMPKKMVISAWLQVNLKGFKASMLHETRLWIALFKNHLRANVQDSLLELDAFVVETMQILSQELSERELDKLLQIMACLNRIEARKMETDELFDRVKGQIDLLKEYDEHFDDNVYRQCAELPDKWNKVKKEALMMAQAITPVQVYQKALIGKRISVLEIRMRNYRQKFVYMDFFNTACTDVYTKLDQVYEHITHLNQQYNELLESTNLFSLSPPDCTPLKYCINELKQLKQLWDLIHVIQSCVESWKQTRWQKIDVEAMDQECKSFNRELRLLSKDVHVLNPYKNIEAVLKNLMTSLRAITELQNPALRSRHWSELMQRTQVQFNMTNSTTLADLLDLHLYKYEEDVKDIVDKSVKEMAMEKMLRDFDVTWKQLHFEHEIHGRTKLKLLRISEEILEILEENQNQLNNMLSSKYIAYFLNDISNWQQSLSITDQVIKAWFEVQRKWTYLESIFIGSDDIRNELPEDTQRFIEIDARFKILLGAMLIDMNIINACSTNSLCSELETLQRDLIMCEKALNDYLETKRLEFPRFYFVSTVDLLDILSNGSTPELVCKHLTKLYDSLAKLLFKDGSKIAKAMKSKENEEVVPFIEGCDCEGKVEIWLNRVTAAMRSTLHSLFHAAILAYEDKPREEWILDWPAQPALCTTQVWWSSETSAAFVRLEGGYENALRDYQKKQINQLNALITLLLGQLSTGDRQKIMTVCTIDVHSRDVVAQLIVQKIKNAAAFQWQSQLRHRWDANKHNCFVNICDAEFLYDFEYLGNTPRLVITPLTDRCYITLTQSLHLILGGAPAGPAGTGKTETTKDLGKGLGIMVYVFNCSEQMDYKSCGNIHKGLALTGAWGCFDEFNRISVEVLSVVAVQVKSILDAIKAKRKKCTFMGEMISLTPTIGLFITMNPGYAGRTELPENLKVLFRPCAMVVPDFALISEIMLVAEGFQEARLLSRKFITLYTLCKELLSKQDHYDWGLRAIKSVLVVAGSLRRSDRNRPEDQVLMRALRDFNIPKIVTDDVAVFMGLIGDLFPALDVPRKRDLEFEEMIKKSAIDLHLQPEDGFVLKVVQLEELFAVRHSVFIVGFAGTGKTQVWKTLFQTYHNQKRRPHYNDLNPKAVTNDELFGIINPATREWKDGLFSVIMRDQANMLGNGPKWIVLDGDIDPMWIESLNTLMDDNKILTLASNERIALTKEMRLLFEIASLRTATPATVSRAGILYINAQDLGWNPFVASWIETRTTDAQKSILTVLFDKYIPPLLAVISTKFKQITPITEVAMIQMTCYLLDCLLTPNNVPFECPKEWFEIYFTFAIIWGFGATLFKDQLIDWRNEFSKWFTNEFNTVKFPTNAGNIFNYYIDAETKAFRPWTDLVDAFELDVDVPLQSVLVSTVETTALRYFIDLLMAQKHPIMFVGGAGTGKTVIVSDKLNALSLSYLVTDVPLNFYTTSEMLQNVLERPLEKKAGRLFGPAGTKTMIYFVDDLNMPLVDTYGTVQAHTLIRQFMDYQHWYDRTRLALKDIQNCQFACCMNPTAGSFTIDPRLQRHFCTFAVNFPSNESIHRIYHSILSQYVEMPSNGLSVKVAQRCEQIVQSAITLHHRMSQQFLPTATKFHYNFNLRDLANVFTGLMYARNDCCPNEHSFVRLWVHESRRVYCDKLVTDSDIELFERTIKEVVTKSVENINIDTVFTTPNIFFHYGEGPNDAKYMPVPNWQVLNNTLERALAGYNELVGDMNLVLFEEAMSHVCRISRILAADRGYVLLIGVGGSGKQSLTRLAAFIASLEVFQTQLKKGFSIADLKVDLAMLYRKTGVKNANSCYLMTDSQVAEEEFLVVINDLLASGNIPDLFPAEDVDNIIGDIRNEVKQVGILDSNENCWKFFIDKVRRLLKVVLCFSPVGATLRSRARKFPSIVNCTNINWFHEWPKTALESVSKRFLADIEVLPNALIEPIGIFMAYVHESVNNMSKDYLTNEKRYNYTTPKTFLELIALYAKLLNEKTVELVDQISKLENGILKLKKCDEQVEELQVQLQEQEVILNVKKAAADKQLAIVTKENDKVQAEKQVAAEREKGVRIIEEDVSAKTKSCAEDLKKAEPAMLCAIAALDTLDKNSLTELKSFGSPSPLVVSVCAAVLVLFSKPNKIPKDRSWKQSKLMMGKVDKFLSDLKNYDKKNISPKVIEALQPYLKDPAFDPDKVRVQSMAAAGLCEWVINIHKFYEVYLEVAPKERALKAAENELRDAQTTLQELNTKLASLQQQLDVLQAELDAASSEKEKCQAEADRTEFKIQLAHRLVNGLASSNVRWRENIHNLKMQKNLLPGDILLISCFISYVGSFTSTYRHHLQNNLWMGALKASRPIIPVSEGRDPLQMICDEAKMAEWNNQGLPNDRMSAENATILTNSARWPLMIDPQLQGIKWIKQKYGDSLIVTRLSIRNYLDVIENSVQKGDTLLIENVDEHIDAVLDPLLGRLLVKKGKVLKLGDREIDYNHNFRLILHTKLANPHYKPELQAQTTLINFTVTRDGLEQQLLAEVVKAERPDLETLKANLTKEQNTFKITLIKLEESLLLRLSSAGEDVLEDETMVLNLEATKKTSAEIEEKVELAKVTTVDIDRAREQYRPVSERAAILYFILNDFHKINKIYQFSLKAFTVVFHRAIGLTPAFETLDERVQGLLESITYQIFLYANRALFERDKIILLAQISLQIMLNAGKIESDELDFLLRFPSVPNLVSPLDFLTNNGWGGVIALSKLDGFNNLDRDLEGSSKRWKTLTDSECPEREKLPGEWKQKTALQRLCIMRALRPDRMSYAMLAFVEEQLGSKFIEVRAMSFEETFQETSNAVHTFFTLSPGVDPLKDVERLGRKLHYSGDDGNFHSVSLGQGQEIVAEHAIDVASEEGGWVILQNIHLVSKWLPSLEKKIEATLDVSHPNYRLFLSAEPAVTAEFHIIPQSILESAIKITNEPPTSLAANLHKSLDNFSDETLDMCSKVTEFKAILFSLCYFHAVVAERRKFGALGWNRIYPFNFGDLTICVDVLYNYLEANNNVPWEDLRFIFGEIMYGGHLTDDFDRRLCRTFLEEYMQPSLIDGELMLAPDFLSPPSLDYTAYHDYIDQNLPVESPNLYGLHSNAEIGVLTTVSEQMFKTIFELQPQMSSNSAGSGASREDVVKQIIEDLCDKIPPEFAIAEMLARIEDRTPYTIVALQECDRMNTLMREIKRSLNELLAGLSGSLTITPNMEDLERWIFYDVVPETWNKLAYPSLLGLQSWFADLIRRLGELEAWTSDFNLPSTVWLAGFFNPQSFLTAIMQQTARKNQWPLDAMCLNCEVTKKNKKDFTAPPREGAYINGLFMEGARWDINSGSIVDSKLKEMFPAMPVIYVLAVPQEKKEVKNVYECPVYKTRLRGPTFVWTFNLKTKSKAAKWILAGVCLLLHV